MIDLSTSKCDVTIKCYDKDGADVVFVHKRVDYKDIGSYAEKAKECTDKFDVMFVEIFTPRHIGFPAKIIEVYTYIDGVLTIIDRA